ncbi:MAG: hypothetical protein OER88_14225, partial [Planctomycetota bacterium]|nr:hypothetical protein [Planctomycetota bacterium]
VFPADPVRVGDSWKADADALAHRLAAYLDSGSKSLMRARFEEIVTQDGRKLAKLYVDWTIEGMRDRRLFTKVTLAGDVYLDMQLGRVTNVDLEGTIIVRGAVIGDGAPKIVKGDGPVSVRMTLKPAPVQAAVGDGSDDDDE